MIGSSKRQDAVLEVLGCLQRYGLSLNDLGDENPHTAKSMSRERLRRLEKAWALVARHGLVFADLEAAGPMPVKSSRARRGAGVRAQVIENQRLLDTGTEAAPHV